LQEKKIEKEDENTIVIFFTTKKKKKKYSLKKRRRQELTFSHHVEAPKLLLPSSQAPLGMAERTCLAMVMARRALVCVGSECKWWGGEGLAT